MFFDFLFLFFFPLMEHWEVKAILERKEQPTGNKSSLKSNGVQCHRRFVISFGFS